jgi:hypothetical protein
MLTAFSPTLVTPLKHLEKAVAMVLSSDATTCASTGRGVLAGAFDVLDALAEADDGLGLTALARAAGLAKTSTYRLAEQLADLGACNGSSAATTSGPGSARWVSVGNLIPH